MNPNIAGLIEIQKLDLEIDALKGRQAQIPGEITGLSEELSQMKRKFEESKTNLKKNELLKKEKQGEIQKIDAEIKDNENKLGAIKSNDVYRAMINIIRELKINKEDLESGLLELMMADDRINQEIKVEEKELKSAEIKAKEEIVKLEKELLGKKEMQGVKETEKAELKTKIDKTFIAKYEKIRPRKGDGVAVSRMTGKACSGCHMMLPPQVIKELVMDTGEIVYCESCSRIMYIADEDALEYRK